MQTIKNNNQFENLVNDNDIESPEDMHHYYFVNISQKKKKFVSKFDL